MANQVEITDYYELVALNKALHAARFSRDSLLSYLSGSPYLADIAKRVVSRLSDMEIERGKPERAKNWLIEIVVNGEVWQIAVNNAASEPSLWKRLAYDKKIDAAKIFLSPFLYTDEMLEKFVEQVDAEAI